LGVDLFGLDRWGWVIVQRQAIVDLKAAAAAHKLVEQPRTHCCLIQARRDELTG
jgi:hypothetical protein